ncbi:MAG: NADH:ubiquinone reductase (Na(+)-transporting) subunit B [Kiritimatiellia bacterium]
MKFLHHLLEKQKPLFEPGGKLERLAPLFEAGESFAFTPADVTTGAPHIRDASDLKRTMMVVVFALLPATLFGIFNAGFQYNHVNLVANASFADHVLRGLILCLPVILVSYIVGGLWEVLFAVVRKHPINEGFLVTGLLFPLTLPPTIPLWQVAVGISFGVVIGKEIFGGTGFNVLNPALTARAVLYFAYPLQLTGDKVWVGAAGHGKYALEGLTGATPLGVAVADMTPGADVMAALKANGSTLWSAFTGLEPGSMGETSVICALIGAAILILSGVGAWRIMAGCLFGAVAVSELFLHFGGDHLKLASDLPTVWQLCIGGFAFGAVFMATDPVSAAATNAGKWIYGLLIGALTITIRSAGGYPEAIMLVILLMNGLAPMIDHYVVQAHIKRRLAYVKAKG